VSGGVIFNKKIVENQSD